MARTHESGLAEPVPLSRLPAAAIRAVLREGYSKAQFKRDLVAGAVVGVVALPLAMALAVAVGAPPQTGLYTAIIAGFLTALLGGSRLQVVGPTAAFVVLLAPIQARFGLEGLFLTGLLAGFILIGLALLRLGSLIEFIPHPVTTGFTAGIGVVIATLQLKDFLGLHVDHMPGHFVERVGAMAGAWRTVTPPEVAVGVLTLGILLYPRLPKRWLARLLPRALRHLPAPLVAIPVVALGAYFMAHAFPAFHVETLGSRFHTLVEGRIVNGVPQLPPLPMLPWHAVGPDGAPIPFTFELIRQLLPGAFAVAMLGAIESLLSAVVVDGMARTKHNPDSELLALGISNVVTPFFGGIAATGAIARTATNYRAGGRTPFASMAHAVTLLIAVLLLAPFLAYIPMASLAALLMVVAWNMSDVDHFIHILKVAPKSDVAVLLTCFLLTVFFDMVIAVSVGVVLASLLFMRRMAYTTQGSIAPADRGQLPGPLPEGVILYDISGPLFFGAAERAMSALRVVEAGTKAVIFRMELVPTIDSTGLVALESALGELRRGRIRAVLVGLQPAVAQRLNRAEIMEVPGHLDLCADMREAYLSLGAPLSTP